MPITSQEQDAEAEHFMPPVGESSIYIYRNELMGGAVAMKIDLDGEQVAVTRVNDYILLVIDPGKHTLTSHAENDDTIELDDRLEKFTMVGKS